MSGQAAPDELPNHVPHARARGTYVAGRTEEDS